MVHFFDQLGSVVGWTHHIFLGGLFIMLIAEVVMLAVVQRNVRSSICNHFDTAVENVATLPISPLKWQLNAYHYLQLVLGRFATSHSYLNVCCIVVMHEESGWTEIFTFAFCLLCVSRAVTVIYQVYATAAASQSDGAREGLLARAPPPLDNFALGVILEKYVPDPELPLCGLSPHKMLLFVRLALEDMPQFILQLLYLWEDGMRSSVDLAIFLCAILLGLVVIWRDLSGLAFDGTPRTVADAAGAADLKTLKHRIHLGESATTADENKMTPAHFAAVSAKMNSDVDKGIEIFSYLETRGANINATDQDGWTPLHHAAAGLLRNNVDALITVGADPTARDRHGNSPLLLAAGCSRRHRLIQRQKGVSLPEQCIGVLSVLLKGGSIANERTFAGESAVKLATGFPEDLTESVRAYLFEHGAENERAPVPAKSFMPVGEVPVRNSEYPPLPDRQAFAVAPKSGDMNPMRFASPKAASTAKSEKSQELPRFPTAGWVDGGHTFLHSIVNDVLYTTGGNYSFGTGDSFTYVKGTGVGISQLNEDNTYFSRTFDGKGFTVHPTRNDAIEGKNKISLSGGSVTNKFLFAG